MCLLEALAAFSGTVVFVSHDRYFIDRLATRVLEVEDGAVTSYEGNYEDYLRRKEAQAAAGKQPRRSDVEDAARRPISRRRQSACIRTRIQSCRRMAKRDGALAPANQSRPCQHRH